MLQSKVVRGVYLFFILRFVNNNINYLHYIFQGRVQIKIVKFDYFIFCDLTFRILYYII